MTTPRTPRTLPFESPRVALVAVTMATFAACNSSDSAERTSVPEGTYDPSSRFFVDQSFSGEAAEVRVQRMYYGRLVDVAWTTDIASAVPPTLVHEDFVIDPRVDSGWQGRYELRTNQITGRQTLVIEADFGDTVAVNGGLSGQEQFIELLRAAESGVRPVADNGFIGAGTFTMVPRNAAVVVVMDDLIDPATVNERSVRVLVGEPTIIPFEARVFPDPNHGAMADFDGIPGEEFYSTRLIVDAAISEEESFESQITANALGLPASADVTLANVEIRIPTIGFSSDPVGVVQNPTQHALTSAPGANGTVDFGTQNREVVRAFRSGGLTSVTADPFNGVLPDDSAPSLVGSQSGVIRGITEVNPAALVYEVDLFFGNGDCAQAPVAGDIVAQGGFFGEVQSPPSGADTYALLPNASALNVRMRLISFPDTFTEPEDFLQVENLPIQFLTPFVAGEDNARIGCFLTISPEPTFVGTLPILSPTSTVSVRFNEPIDPQNFEPYESFSLVRQDDLSSLTPAQEASDFIAGTVLSNVSFREFRFLPSVPLNTSQAGYSLDLGSGARSPRDFAGNAVLSVPGSIPLGIQTTDPVATGSRVVRFSSRDEEFPFADLNSNDPIEILPKPEFQGQTTFNLARGTLRGRPVVRTQATVTRSNPIPANMNVGAGWSFPLSPYGARTQILWRYIDFAGLPFNEDNDIAKDLDLQGLNLDVEGVSLSPIGGNPVFESFPEFQMSMAHSAFAPDEVINPATGALVFPNSGLQTTFANNLADPVNDPLQLVHPRASGFIVQPGDQFSSTDGTPLIPMPMNRGVPAAQRSYYTWRDTGLAVRAGANSGGVPVQRDFQVTGSGPFQPAMGMGGPLCGVMGAPNPMYISGEVRTAGLPLLIDFRCYPTGGETQANFFDTQTAHASTLPGFRAFTAGGRNVAGALVTVDPDMEILANGGLNPSGTPPGSTVPGLDNVVYLGGLDLVTRVSRCTSIFYPALDPVLRDGDPMTLDFATYAAPEYAEPTVFPAVQPQGTRVELAYRGLSGLATPTLADAANDATRSDYYGDFYTTRPINFDPQTGSGFAGGASCFDGSFNYLVANENAGLPFLASDNTWKDDVAELAGARWFQVRISLISNPETTLVPEISAVGFAWEQD